MNTPVNFELAKLLKEKGFNLKVNLKYAFCEGGDIDGFKTVYSNAYENFNLEYPERKKFINKNKVDELEEFSAPTIAEVVMWIYEKHGIWVSVNYGKGSQTWGYIICENENKENRHFGFDKLNQAYEAAIEYCLNKLI